VADGPPLIDRPVAAAVHSRPAALVLLALLALVWGSHWTVVKIGLTDAPPLTYGLLRVGIALVATVALLAVMGRLSRPTREDLPVILSVGLLPVAAAIILMNLALLALPAGRSAVLVYTMPLWVAVILAIRYRTLPRPNELVGLALGLAGLALLLSPAVIDWSDPAELVGTACLLASAVVQGATTIHVRRHHWVSTPLQLQPAQLVVALAPLGLGVLAVERDAPVDVEPALIGALLFSGVLATAFATWASTSIARAIGPQATATGYLAVPVVGLVTGWLVLGERLGLADLAGFALVLAGIAVTSLLIPTPVEGRSGPGGEPDQQTISPGPGSNHPPGSAMAKIEWPDPP
jgi:drug/metabolite transporter (DMT)-like permease